MTQKKWISALLVLFLCLGLVTGCGADTDPADTTEPATEAESQTEPAETESQSDPEPAPVSLNEIPAFSGEPYIVINNNKPFFQPGEIKKTSFESYAPLDHLGRCGVAVASIGRDLMPTEKRGSIGMIKPSGWVQKKYDFVDGKYLYNRCHLIGHQLTGEDANPNNLVTGTRFFNVDGMLPFEDMTADYVKETGNHVMYRITPIFKDNNLLCSGVLMEGLSVEDNGAGLEFCVYAYNAQPRVGIDYATGDNWLDESVGNGSPQAQAPAQNQKANYVINTNTGKFHTPDCSSVDSMKPQNTKTYNGNRQDLINQGYTPCGNCNP